MTTWLVSQLLVFTDGAHPKAAESREMVNTPDAIRGVNHSSLLSTAKEITGAGTSDANNSPFSVSNSRGPSQAVLNVMVEFVEVMMLLDLLHHCCL